MVTTTALLLKMNAIACALKRFNANKNHLIQAALLWTSFVTESMTVRMAVMKWKWMEMGKKMDYLFIDCLRDYYRSQLAFLVVESLKIKAKPVVFWASFYPNMKYFISDNEK